MRIETWPIDRPKPYPNNPRINDDAVKGVADSIQAFGWQQPIVVDSDGVVIVGHTRLKAAKLLGLKEVPVTVADDLTPDEVAAYRLADNRTAEKAAWNMDALKLELKGIELDMSPWFDKQDLSWSVGNEQEIVEDEPPEDAEPRANRGDVWQLGRHRVMCGDSTITQDVATLMDGNRADVCFTSPPYNMNVNVPFDSAPNIAMGAGAAYQVDTDDKTDTEYADMLCASLGNALSHCDDALFNIGILAGSKRGIADMVHAYADKLCDVVVWNKSQSMPHGMESQRGMLSHRCELVFCFNQTGSRSFTHPQWKKGTGINRIDTENAACNEYASQHHATFPVSFAASVLRMFTDDSVLDLFGGTGTTLIAAEQLGRTCYMMELDPHYVDVIIERWEQLTGGNAVRVTPPL